MTIENCPSCGGTHIGSTSCPMTPAAIQGFKDRGARLLEARLIEELGSIERAIASLQAEERDLRARLARCRSTTNMARSAGDEERPNDASR